MWHPPRSTRADTLFPYTTRYRARVDRLGPDRRLALDRAGDPHAVVERVILRHARTEQRRERPRLALGPQRVGIVLHARTRAEHEMAAAADIGFEMLRLRLGHDVEIGRDHERLSREISLGRAHMDPQIGRASWWERVWRYW